MCGIAGLVRFSGAAVEPAVLQSMVDCLAHRGPDHQAILIEGNLGVGHTRLSIIDCSHGADQPFADESGRYCLIYNGEVFNYQALRAELVEAGLSFRTTSDTEVLLNAFIHWGEGCLQRINGMFAFVVLDRAERTLLAARDRFGIKPFHYAELDGDLVFASEVKAICRAAPGRLRMDALKTVELLLYKEAIRDSLLSDIKTLEPGHCLKVRIDEPGSPAIRRWFHVSDLPDPVVSRGLRSLGRAGRVDALERVLVEAVERHLVSDVPVGSLCSGGVDSSLMTAMACRVRPDITVYHVDVEDVSERRWAEQVAEHLKIDLNLVVLNKQNYLAKYIECIWFNDAPLTHPQNVPIFYISELARTKGCKVLLTGEGADEGFGGYDWRYRLRRNYRRLERATGILSRLRRKLVFLTTGLWTARFNPAFGFKTGTDPAAVLGLTADQHFRSSLERECRAAYGFVANTLDREVQAAMTADLRDYVGGILHQQDRASMQASIESRVPFLDIEVARFAANLPLGDKFSWRHSKLLLKQVALRYLPRPVVQRPKIGFASPASDYVMAFGLEVFDRGFLVRELGLDAREVGALLTADPGAFAHMLYGLEFWGRMFVWGDSPQALSQRFVP